MSENNLKQNNNENKTRTYVLATLIAGCIGFIAIYVTFGRHDNEEPLIAQQTAANSLKKIACPRQIPTGVHPLQRYNCGDMVSFLIHKTPMQINKIAFNNALGETISLEKWRGKYVLLNIWATWCAPCRKEMPDLDELKTHFKDKNFDVVAISIDRGSNTKPKRFLEKIGVKNIDLYNDPKNSLIGPLRVLGMPTTLLINPEGLEIGRMIGPAHWASVDAKRLIEKAIN